MTTNIIVDNNGVSLTAGTYTYLWVGNSLNVCLQAAVTFCFEDSFVSFGPNANGANPTVSRNLGCTSSNQFTYVTAPSDSYLTVGVRARKYLGINPLGAVLTSFRVSSPSQSRPLGNTQSYFVAFVTVGATTFKYYANAADLFNSISTTFTYRNETIYSFQDPNNPVYYGNVTRVNWLINQDIPEVYVRNGRFPFGYGPADIQATIWCLMHPGRTIPGYTDCVEYGVAKQGANRANVNFFLNETLNNPAAIAWKGPQTSTDYDSILAYAGEAVADIFYHVRFGDIHQFTTNSRVTPPSATSVKGIARFDCNNDCVLQTSESNSVLPGATVNLYDTDDSLLATTTSDNLGKFTFVVSRATSYKVSIANLGTFRGCIKASVTTSTSAVIIGFDTTLDSDGDSRGNTCDLCLGFDDKIDADGDGDRKSVV